jgi:hypothetical protein
MGVCVGPWDVGAVAEGMLMIEFWKETSEGDVPGGITESIVVTFRRLLTSMLVIVGREIVDGRDVILRNCDSDNVDGRAVRLLIVGSDTVDGRPVILLIVGRDTVDGKAVMLIIGEDNPEIVRRGAEVTGSMSMIG